MKRAAYSAGASVSRRVTLHLLGGACLASACRPAPSAEAAQQLSRGCFLTPRGFAAYRSQNERLFALNDGILTQAKGSRSTGNASLDRELDRALRVAADVFEVNPAFGFFDPDKFREPELHSMNAFAWPKAVGIPGTTGLVGFGASLFRNELFGYDETGATVMGVVAHEYAHILQFSRGYFHQLSVLDSEINADFLAGYYIGTRRIKVPSVRFERVENLFFRKGRSNDGDAHRTHGSSSERVAAVRAGFRAGYAEGLSLDQAVKAGWEYVSNVPTER
ncbi:MAG: hypothetical protein KJZ80_17000 [Hyphomicrobiaceae bacterium]|nr:hypothetical protein [Hyphomicrobiaceae bacterium]